MRKEAGVQIDSDGFFTKESDDLISREGGLISPKFLEHLKKKVADAYDSNGFAHYVAQKRIERIKSAHLADASSGFDACYVANDNMVLFNRVLFDKLKFSADGSDSVIPVIAPNKARLFLECGVHEINHAASVRKNTHRNRNGKLTDRFYEFSVAMGGKNTYAMEAINTIITANQTDIPSDSYFASSCGCFPLNLIFGKNVLQDLAVVAPEMITKSVEKLSADQDYFGKISLLSAIANYYDEQAATAENEIATKEANDKYYRVLDVITGLATRDLVIPFLCDYPQGISKKDKVIEFVRSNDSATSPYMQTLMFYQVIFNNCDSYADYCRKVDRDFEEVVSEANGLAYEINPNGLASYGIAGVGSKEKVAPYLNRQIIGLNEYAKMDEDTRRAYEQYVQSICEQSDGTIEFESKPIRSEDVRETGKFIPDVKSQKDIYLFDYVASKLGYNLDGFKTYLAKDSTFCTVERKLLPESADLEDSYQMFNNEVWKCTGLYDGAIYFSNPELDA